MIVKVCGLKDEYQVKRIEKMADFIGFIYYNGSSRYVDNAPHSSKAKRVGVFVNASVETIRNKVLSDQLDIVQLHGDESPAFINGLNVKTSIIKAFGIHSQFNFRSLLDYENSVDYYLFDTKCKNYGGSGQQFDWTILNRYNLTTPFILAGGINLNSAQSLKKINHPLFTGVDLNSGFELSPGNKDIKLLETFINTIKND